MRNNGSLLIVSGNTDLTAALEVKAAASGFSEIYTSLDLGLDTTVQSSVYKFFQDNKPAYVVLDSVLSGGIGANQSSPADFSYQNSESQNNVVYASWKFLVKKLIYIGASCMYPVSAEQPIKEDTFLTGPVEETSRAYAAAKINGTVMCKAFAGQHEFRACTVVPATVYGSGGHGGDNAHVLNAVMDKCIQAVSRKEDKIILWGSGKPLREFIHVDDLAEAIFLLFNKADFKGEIYNAGSGEEVTIRQLAELIAEVTGFKGTIEFNASKPDGAMRKFLDSSRIHGLGYTVNVSLKDGLKRSITTQPTEVSA